VEIHGEHAVDTHGGEQIGHDLGGDGHAGRAQAAVLAGIAEIGDHRGDSPCRRAAHRVDHDQQFHQVLIGRGAGGLDHEDVASADILVDLHMHLAVAEAVDCGVAKLRIEARRDAFGQCRDGIPSKQFHI